MNTQFESNISDVDAVISKLLEKVPAEQVRSLIAFAKSIDAPVGVKNDVKERATMQAYKLKAQEVVVHFPRA